MRPKEIDEMIAREMADFLLWQLDDFQEWVGGWAERTFPHSTPRTIVAHLLREAVELAFAVGLSWTDIEAQVGIELERRDNLEKDLGTPAQESAGVVLLLTHLAHKQGFSLRDAVKETHLENMSRTWGAPDEAGVSEHLP